MPRSSSPMGMVALRWWAKFFRGNGRPCEVSRSMTAIVRRSIWPIGRRRGECEDAPAVAPDDEQNQLYVAAPDGRLCQPVSVTYRTGLWKVEMEIGKWRAETGARKPPVQ